VDAKQVTLVQQTFEKAAALGEQVADIFYAELFAIEPALQSMFKGNMAEQKKKLLAALAMVVRSLHVPEAIIKPAQSLAVKHLDYGVKPEHYAMVGNALLRTLKKGLGAEYTAEVETAWTAAYGTLANLMKEAAYGGKK
jgi:hemoglobin-like flavoprotein